jgi:hypothetical protein
VDNNGFWTEIIPALATRFCWEKSVMVKFEKDGWEKCLKSLIKDMDDEEFQLFMAQVVMTAASKQIMGVDLTAQIGVIKALRK